MSLSSLMTNLVNHTGNRNPFKAVAVHAYGDERPKHYVVIPGVNHHDIYKEPHLSRLLVWCLTNTLMKMREHFGRRQGAMTCRGDRRSPLSGRYHARKSNAADGQKDPQIRKRICETPH